MARAQIELSIDQVTWTAADQQLANLVIQVRGKAISGAIRKVGNAIKSQTKSILPKPGYPGDKPGLAPLRETMKVKVKEYEGGAIKVMVVGYTYSRTPGVGGNHGHLLEGGHDIVTGGSKKKGGTVIGHVAPHEYMIRVVNTTKPQQQSILITAVKDALKKP
jgi:hypothetical protein